MGGWVAERVRENSLSHFVIKQIEKYKKQMTLSDVDLQSLTITLNSNKILRVYMWYGTIFYTHNKNISNRIKLKVEMFR